MQRFAAAKINLTLEILRKRDDGFHELASLMHTIDLADELTFAIREDGNIHLNTEPVDLCAQEDNLVFKAARLLQDKSQTTLGADISLLKRVPHGAGLGGGSSDAATTLMALNDLWELGLAKSELAELGAGLGSDISFFFDAPSAIVRGRGEQVEPVKLGGMPSELGPFLTLVYPALAVSTPAVYQSGLIDLQSPRVPIDAEPCLPFNRLQEACLALVPEVSKAMALADKALESAKQKPSEPAFLSGSGSAFLYFWENMGHASAAAELIRKQAPKKWQVFATRLA